MASQVAGAPIAESAIARSGLDASLVACAAIAVAVGVFVGDVGFGAVIALDGSRAGAQGPFVLPLRHPRSRRAACGAIAVVAGLAFGQLFDATSARSRWQVSTCPSVE